MDEIDVALSELRWLTDCRCDPSWTDRMLHAPDCHYDSREDVEVLAKALGRGLT